VTASIDRLLAITQVPKRFAHARLENFELETDIDLLQTSLFIYGPSGSGKTHLLCALSLRLLGSRFVTADDILMEIKASYSGDSEKSERAIVEYYSHKPVLMIDDVGATRITDWGMSVFHSIIDKRYTGLKRTYITSNLDLKQLEDVIDPRTCRRIGEMCTPVKVG
jgi:DNA replication protein DnaC